MCKLIKELRFTALERSQEVKIHNIKYYILIYIEALRENIFEITFTILTEKNKL